MELKVLDSKEYKKYALKSKYISIYQLPEWGELKKSTGWIPHLLGLFNNKENLGVTMLLEKKILKNTSLFYTPRGYLTDVYNYNTLEIFHKEIVNYVKNNHGFLLKVDPNVIMNIRNMDGEILNDDGKVVYDNFIKLGFKHLGFTKNFENLQPRYLCRIKLESTYEDTLNTFTKSTRKNIEKAYSMGVRVKKGGLDDIETFVHLLEKTGNMKNFIVRPVSYYKKQYELMKDYITIYITYIDTNIYYNNIKEEIKHNEEELNKLMIDMNKMNVGSKMVKKLTELESKKDKLQEELKDAEELKSISKEINIASLMSIFIGNEGITFTSGTDAKYKKFNPKYAFYNEHIKDSIDKKLEYVNFYGISGDMNKNNPYYGIYEIKKGFNPEITELVGEFDYIINPIIYHSYNIALKGYKFTKKFKR